MDLLIGLAISHRFKKTRFPDVPILGSNGARRDQGAGQQPASGTVRNISSQVKKHPTISAIMLQAAEFIRSKLHQLLHFLPCPIKIYSIRLINLILG
jgi:hypothetical protein